MYVLSTLLCYLVLKNSNESLLELNSSVLILQEPDSDLSMPTLLKNSACVVRYPLGGDCVLLVDGITREGAAEVLWKMDADGKEAKYAYSI